LYKGFKINVFNTGSLRHAAAWVIQAKVVRVQYYTVSNAYLYALFIVRNSIQHMLFNMTGD